MSTRLTKFFAWVYINLVRIFNWTELYQPTFNPNNYFLFRGENKKRDSQDRVDFIEKVVDFSKVQSYLDIGSQLGYFVFKIAEKRKLFAQGLEMAYVSHTYSNAIVTLNSLDNISFIKGKLTSEMAGRLPSYDVISFLNVFHHIVHFEGFEEADKIMKILGGKCDIFIFETGQNGEEGQYWSDKLGFMGSDPEKWLIDYLGKLGFNVLSKKQFPNHLNNKSRTFFICKKI